MDKTKLDCEILKAGITKKDLCTKIGLSRSAFHRKCTGDSSFTIFEVEKIMDTLNLKNPDLFFTL